MKDDYFLDEYDIEEEPPKRVEKKNSGVKLILSGCLIIIIFTVIGLYFAFLKAKKSFYNCTSEALIIGTRTILTQMELPKEEIDSVIVPLKKLSTRIKNQKITMDELKKIGRLFFESHIPLILFSKSFELSYILKNPKISKKDKMIAHKIINRYSYGISINKIKKDEYSEVYRILTYETVEYGKIKRKFKKHLSQQEIMKCLNIMKSSILKHKIENKNFHINIGNDVKKIIDKVLDKPSTSIVKFHFQYVWS